MWAARCNDSFTVLSADGTAQVVTVTINGTNDAAVITGTSSGDVTEAGGVANGTAGTPTATGDLLATDVDNAADAFQAVAAGAATVNGYGSYELTAAGVWTYTLDDSNAAVQALNVGGTLQRQLHRAERGRHRAAGDDHHQRHQRRGGDHAARARRQPDGNQCGA